MIIVYYKALWKFWGRSLQQHIYTYQHELATVHREIREVGLIRRTILPPRQRYFANPDVDPLTPEWQGENVIDLRTRLYYGHVR